MPESQLTDASSSQPVTASFKTVLGFDYGTRKIGVAVGQTVTGSATPLAILGQVRQQPDWNAIAGLIDEWRPQALVVGLPYNMDDTETEVAARARRFARQLEGRFRLPVFFADERLTSRTAASISGGDHGKLDALAASLILETWFCDQR